MLHDHLMLFVDLNLAALLPLLTSPLGLGSLLVLLNLSLVAFVYRRWRTSVQQQQALREHHTQTLAQVHHQLRHDPLTSLPNRRAFTERLEQVVQTYRDDQTATFAVLFLDLDRFSTINDTLGHVAGDQILLELGLRLQARTSVASTVARMSGDTFMLLVDTVADPAAPVTTIKHIQSVFSQPFCLQNQEIFMSASIGAVLGDNLEQTADSLLREADTAVYQAKAHGLGQWAIFDRARNASLRARMQLEIDLRGALERTQLDLAYQPIMDLPTGDIVGMEALLRWQHPHHGIIYPSQFIPLAEETGLIVPIGLWTLETACRQFQTWHTSGALPSLRSISVNLSGKQFANPDLVSTVQRIIEHTGIAPQHLELELTESVVMGQADHAVATLRQLKALGVQLAIDDFGTGYSSLSYLHQFPIDTLKVDRSFVSAMHNNYKHVEIVRTIIALSQNLAMSVIAEGIETTEQAAVLRDMGCDYGQGYHFARPLDASTMLRWMQQRGDRSVPYHHVAHQN